MAPDWNRMWSSATAAIISLSWLLVGASAPGNPGVDAESDEVDAFDTHAVFVAVTAYPHLPQQSIEGAKHDALLLRRVLLDRGVPEENITMVIEPNSEIQGVEPTRDNILGALRTVGAQVQSGDQLVVHIGGLGTQMVADSSDDSEPDGFEELLLAKDAAPWDPEAERVPGAILDDELELVLAGIRDKGVYVWAIFDTCFSGAMSRGDVTMRAVDPNDLRIPGPWEQDLELEEEELAFDEAPFDPMAMSEVVSRGLTGVDGAPPPGGLVMFHAARAEQETPEMELPRQGDSRQRHGLFSYQIAKVLSTAPGLTYREMADRIFTEYGLMAWNRTLPLFEGDLDLKVLGTRKATVDLPTATAESTGLWRVNAGQLHGFGDGTEVALLRSPSDPTEEAVVQGVVTQASALESQVQPTDEAGLPASPKTQDVLYARILSTPVPLSVRYSITSLRHLTPEDRRRVEVALASMTSSTSTDQASRFELLPATDGEPADIHLFGSKGELYFLRDDEPTPCTQALYACSDADQRRSYVKLKVRALDFEQALATHMAQIGASVNLHRVAYAVGNAPSGLDVEMSTLRSGWERGPCPSLKRARQRTTDYERNPRTMGGGDCLYVSIHNPTDAPRDIHMMFLDSLYGVHYIYPNSRKRERSRLDPGATMEWSSGVDTETYGHEEILVVSMPVGETDMPSSLRFLEQAPLDATVQSRGLQEAEPEDCAGPQELLCDAVRGNDHPDEVSTADSGAGALPAIDVLWWQTVIADDDPAGGKPTGGGR